MGRFSKDKLRSRGKHGAWILECQIQCCSEGYLCSLAEFLVYYHVSDIWMAFWELQRKMCNGQSINCLLGKFSPTRMIKSGSEKAWEDISELFINYHCYLFPEIGTESSVPELVWRHKVQVVPLPLTLADPWQACDKLLISLQFFTPVLSLFCCALVWLLHIPSPSTL